MKIEIIQQQNLFQVNEDALTRYALWIMEQVTALAPEIQWQELSMVLTDDSIRSLNQEWFGKDTVTDVISFAYPEAPATGEIIVNLQQAMEEGKLRDSADEELSLYIAHGCHHLMGAEDDTPERKNAMLTLENQWVTSFKALHGMDPYFI
ncbi:rRNA maturation RNase YbeY [Kiritimatiellota bacterium B12222]|nr:rRNA maturation RNase YbeY [Kiritimatiellota bacterium B12222]